MRMGSHGWAASQACRCLAGLETGVWAGLATLGWFLLTAAWSHHSVWLVPNRLGSLLHPAGDWRAGFQAATLVGTALHLFSSGVVGILFACLAGEGRRRLRMSLLSMATGLLWCYLSYALFWKRLLPPAPGPSPSLLAAYLVFGLVLGCYSGRLRSAERCFLGEAPPPGGTGPPPEEPSGG